MGLNIETRKTSKHMLITPEIAREMLATQGRNRKVSTHAVSDYTMEMSNERWVYTGDTIKFNTEGKLIDGQHRLHAVIGSGISREFLVAFGVDKRAMPLLDRHRSRTPAQAMDIADFENPTVLAPVASLVMRYEKPLVNVGDKISRRGQAQNRKLFDRVENDSGLRKAANFIAQPHIRGGLRGLLSFSHVGLVYYMGSKTSPDKVEEFVEKLVSGEGLISGDPIHTLRERMIRGRKGGKKIEDINALAMLIKAWRAYEGGRQMKNLQFRETETFPKFLCEES